MLPASESNSFVSNIPKVKELREALGFGDQALLQSKIFNDKLRAFRREYQTSSGVAGTDLHRWKSAEQQAELSRMVHDFLKANGSVFWPDRADDGNEFVESSSLQYSRDKPIIIRTLKQLIFRQNQQEFRNLKYKGKDQDKVGSTDTDPIIIDSGSTNDNLDLLLDPAISLRQPIKEAAQKENDPKPIQSPNKNVPFPGSGPKQGHSGVKRMGDTHERAQPLVKRRKAPEKKGEARDAAPFRTPGNPRTMVMPGERSSERTRSKPERSGFVPWSEVHSPTPTPTPTQRIPAREKRPASRVEADPRMFPLSPDASNAGGGTATPDASSLGRVSSTPEKDKQSHPDVPEETGGKADANANAGKETSPVAQISAPSPAPAMPFTITYLVMWREPSSEYEIWHPDGGKFLDKTLNQVILELSTRRLRAKVTSVSFKLSLADDDDGSQPKWRMQRDDELGFGMMKKRLKSQISVWLKEKTIRPLLLEMEIEPVCDDVEEAEKEAIQDASDDVSF